MSFSENLLVLLLPLLLGGALGVSFRQFAAVPRWLAYSRD